jgi:RNA polymerase sigma-70 factor (ECF subfamily)
MADVRCNTCRRSGPGVTFPARPDELDLEALTGRWQHVADTWICPICIRRASVNATVESGTPSGRNDNELVSQLAQHSEEAFTELFQRHSREVGATSRRILGGAPHSDDIVAEVFLGLWLAPESFDPERGPLLAFLRTKARGKSIDRIRSESARRRRELLLAMGSSEGFDMHGYESDQTESLLLALASLSTNEREPIELAYFQGMKYRAISVYLGIPEGTAKARIRSGLRRMRESIEAQRQSDEALEGA